MKSRTLTLILLVAMLVCPIAAFGAIGNLIDDAKFGPVLDSNGNPLASGKLYTYECGTTTNKTTYSDRALTTPNANPVVLSSRGEADVYGTGCYKLALKTSADVEVWTVDNVWGTVGGTYLQDSDNDTLVQVEEGADDDTFRVDTNGTERMKIISTGEMTMATQPAFLVQKGSAQTNLAAGAATQVTWDTERFDKNMDFASSVFTAPVTGLYHFSSCLYLQDVDTASTQVGIQLVTTGRTFANYINPTEWNEPIYLTVDMTDISTAGSVWVTSPVTGTFTKLYSVINGAISGDDAAITTEIGGTAVTGGALTIAYSGSAAGTVDSATPSANNSLNAGLALEIISDGGSTDVCRATFTVEISNYNDIGIYHLCISNLADMTAGNTAQIKYQQTGGTAQTDISETSSYFSGRLVQ